MFLFQFWNPAAKLSTANEIKTIYHVEALIGKSIKRAYSHSDVFCLRVLLIIILIET